MKKVIGWVGAWSLFWMGDLVSRFLVWESFIWLFPLYEKLMGLSYLVQEWAENESPWKKVNEEST